MRCKSAERRHAHSDVERLGCFVVLASSWARPSLCILDEEEERVPEKAARGAILVDKAAS